MRNIFLAILIAGLIQFSFFSCSKTVPAAPIDYEYDYFPLEIGHYSIYQVDSIIFDPDVAGIRKDSVSVQMKEAVVDTFRDNTGALRYKIERSFRDSTSAPWQINHVYSANIEDRRANVWEHNLHIIPLSFPPDIYDYWSGTAALDEYISFEVAGEPIQIFKTWDYYYNIVDTTFETAAGSFTSVVGVEAGQIHNSEDALDLEQRLTHSFYAKGVGLIYKEWRIMDTQCQYCCNYDNDLCDALNWEDKAEAGFILRQELIAYH